MKKLRRKYKRPRKPWDKERIEQERELIKEFGLTKKKEIWRSETLLRKYRRMARRLSAKKDKEKEKELVKKLASFGILPESSGLDDVLSLNIKNILERRLQTVIFRKGLANTPKQSRQFIVHGHVLVDGRKTVHPGRLLNMAEEGKIQVIVVPKNKKVI